MFFCFANTPSYKAVVTGKISHYNAKIPFSLGYSQIGLERKTSYPEIDQDGNFRVELEVYLPTEVWLSYNNSFPVIISPNDSLHVEFDGNLTDRNQLMNATKYSGKSKVSNEQFTEMNLFAWNNLNLGSKTAWANKNLKPEEFKIYADSVAQQEKQLHQVFRSKNKTKGITQALSEQVFKSKYTNLLAYYSLDFRDLNNLSPFDTVLKIPSNYYQFVEESLPLNQNELISTNDFEKFVRLNKLHLNQKLKRINKPSDNWTIDAYGILGTFNDFTDDIRLKQYIDHIKDPLLLEILITDYLSNLLVNQKINSFEKQKPFIDQYVKSDFLKIPLEKQYLRVKMNVENPIENSEIIIKELSKSSLKEIMNTIRKENKDKIIYIDIWATWCGPCIGSFPNSRLLEHRLKDEKVAFVYLCLGTDEKIHKALINEHQLKGQHYFLNPMQAKDLQKSLTITGVPFYLIMNKKGEIVDSGSHLVPTTVEHKIKELTKL